MGFAAMKRFHKISLKVPKGALRGIFFCLLLLSLVLPEMTVEAEEQTKEPGELYALSAALLDGDTGRLLYGKESDVKRANASTTKIMTCIITLENGNLDDMIGVSEYAASMPNVQLNIESGEYYRLEDMLYSLMLESHNDAAVAIAEHVGGSVEGFSKLMNDKARELGCKNTLFITPNGLDINQGEDFHGTTAEDLAKIMSYCAWQSPKKDQFLAITRTKEHRFTNYKKQDDGSFTQGTRSFSCGNHNTYLYQNAECLTGKTGFTGEAGYCYVCALESDGRKFAIALLGSGWPNNKNYKWKDCDKLYAFGKENFHKRQIPDCSGELQKIMVLGAANSDFDFRKKAYVTPYTDEITGDILMADWENLRFQTTYPKAISAKKCIDKNVGKVEVFIGNEPLLQRDIKVTCKNGKRDLYWYFRGVAQKWYLRTEGN